MKKVVKQNKKGFYYYATEIEVKDILLLLFCVVTVGAVLIKELVK